MPSISSGDAGKVLTVNSLENGVEWAAGGGGSSYTFTNGLTNNNGTVSWDLNDLIQRKSNNNLKLGVNASGNDNISGTGSAFIGRNLGGNAYTSNTGIILGYANYGRLQSYGQGSVAMGFAKESKANMSSSSDGSIAGGYVTAGQSDISLQASAKGSIALGYADATYGYLMSSVKGSVALGTGVKTSSDSNLYGQVVLGRCNDNTNQTDKVLIIGNGTNNSNRSNALTVDWDGNLVCNNIPAPPSSDGNYVLQCSVSSGVATYTWVAQS